VQPVIIRDNLLLSTLEQDAYQRLQPEIVPLKLAETLYDANSTVSHAYFPGRSTMLSVIAETSDGEQAEIGVVGREGVAPMASVLDSATTPHRIFVQGNGNAVRVTADSLKSEFQRNERFRSLLLHYTQAFFIQVSQTALCNRLHEIEQRLARWLLLSEDRTQQEEMPLTHEFLAKMLGVNRASVSLNAELLKKAGIIDYRRGKVRVVNRAALESVSCACYAEVKKHYQLLLNF
jgi:CRP-like cAMP-binding protein